MYNIKNKTGSKIESATFSELGMKETDLEEILRTSIDMICDEEESMLIVGRQVKDEKLKRSDLTAVDNNGNIVLIEIKRDKKDIEGRKEAFEFQAIRYAASYATIENVEDMVIKVYAPYIEKYRSEYIMGSLTPYEFGFRQLSEFLQINDAVNSFNEKQKIILVASDFDDHTLSAVAWLNNNNVDISCYKLNPYKINEEIYIDAEKILPLNEYTDYYVNLMENNNNKKMGKSSDITRRTMPKIDSLLKWGVVKAGDIIVAKGRDDEGILLKNGNVKVGEKQLSLQIWLKELYGWSSIQTYNFAVHKESGKTLSQIREEYMLEVADRVK